MSCALYFSQQLVSDRFLKKNIGGGVADRQEGGGAAGTNM